MATGTIPRPFPTADKVGACNPNYLDNPWFMVNQRKITGTGAPAGGATGGDYIRDMWFANYINCKQGNQTNGGSYVVEGEVNGIPTKPIFLHGGQKYTEGQWGAVDLYTIKYGEDAKPLMGKTVTFSALTAQGLKSVTGAIPATFSSTYTFIASAWIWEEKSISLIIEISAANELMFIIRNQLSDNAPVDGDEIWIYGAKVEVGNVSTLHKETPLEYVEYLTRCRRYFYANTSTNEGGISLYPISSDRLYFHIPANLRRVGVVTFQDFHVLDNGGTWYLVNSGGHACAGPSGDVVYFFPSAGLYTAGQVYLIKGIVKVSTGMGAP